MATKTSKRQDLEVHLGNGGQMVGRLHLGSGKRSAFSYDEEWLQDARFFRLSPDLQPVLSVQYPRQVFFDALEDTGPDSWGERVIRRAHAKLRQQDRETPALEPVDFINWVDDEARVGALRLFDTQSRTYLRSGETHCVLTEAMTAAAFPTPRGRRCCSPMAAVRPMPIRNW